MSNWRQWWDDIGSGKRPLDGHDMEDHAGRISRMAYEHAERRGVACHKHDLTHAVACGRCYDEAQAEIDRLREALDSIAVYVKPFCYQLLPCSPMAETVASIANRALEGGEG